MGDAFANEWLSMSLQGNEEIQPGSAQGHRSCRNEARVPLEANRFLAWAHGMVEILLKNWGWQAGNIY